MPKNIIGQPPYKVRTLDTDRLINSKDINAFFLRSNSVSLCIRTESGHAERGGYFFHIKNKGNTYQIYDFEKKEVCTFSSTELVRFINHVTGRQFDPEMLNYCQTVINIRQDQSESGKET